MKTLTRQEGVTMWSGIGLALIGVFLLLLMFKLFPPYLDDLKVGSAISRIAARPGAGSFSSDELKQSIDKNFNIENITHVSARNDVEIIPRGQNAKQIKLQYEREIPLVWNISVLLYFDHQEEVR